MEFLLGDSHHSHTHTLVKKIQDSKPTTYPLNLTVKVIEETLEKLLF